MKKAILVLLGSVCFTLAAGVSFAQDAPGCKEHALFPTRMPGYRIEACKVEEYGIYEFWAAKGPKTPVEGKFTSITYTLISRETPQPSALAVVRNYENAIRSAGGAVLHSVPTWWTNGKIVKDGREAWVQAEKGNGKIWLRIVEKTAMTQYVEADAAAFSNGLRTTGHAAVYDITFDTGKAEIKPDSARAMGEIAKVLKEDPALKIFVVGHTDAVGAVDANLKLSQDRAQAVMQALVRDHGIAAVRLRAHGCGQFAPVASNDSEEGRAKNRRVELVKQ